MKVTLTKRVELLEQQQSLTVELCRRVLEGRWTGGAESAEAVLLALNPDLAGELRAVPFPGPGAEPPRVPILNTEGEDIRPLLEAAVEGTAVPLELALACAIAESGLSPRAERWGRQTTRARLLLRDAGFLADGLPGYGADLATAMGELRDIVRVEWPDISFGYGQRIVIYHYLGDRSPAVENCLAVREAVFADPGRDLREMALRLESCIDTALGSDLSPVEHNSILGALVVYNAGHLPEPGADWWRRWVGNVESYRSALEQARAMA